MTTDSLRALYFPGTLLATEIAEPLLLLFSKLLSYRPAEGSPALPQPLSAAGLVESYPPAPLGDELDRFRRLLKDMQTHTTEYYQAYLSSLTADVEEDLEAGWRQVARRLKQSKAEDSGKEDGLWRARLYLALAEYHATMQEELTMGIEAVAKREANLLLQLHGEIEELAELPLSANTPAAPTGLAAPHQLAAWGRLYLADSRPDRPWLLVTAQEESAGLLFEEYEQATGRRPEKMISLSLPSLTTDSEKEGLEKRGALRVAASDLLTRIGDFLTEAAFAEADPGPAASESPAAELGVAWQQTMAQSEEALPEKPTAALTFYRLPAMSFPRLFSLFCREEENNSAGQASPHAILAVLTQKDGNSER